VVEIVLHIGDGKCGSTSIQQSLHATRHALAEAGILYLPDKRNLSHFTLAALAGGRIRGARADGGGSVLEGMLRSAVPAWANLLLGPRSLEGRALENLRDIRRAWHRTRPGHVVLSAESFFALQPQAIMGILDQLTIPVTSIHLVAYVRSPVSMYLALNQQKLKASHNMLRPDRWRRDIALPFERWSASGLCRSIHLGRFETAALAGGSVVADFAEVLGRVTGIAGLTLPEQRANVSLSAEQMVVLQRFRRDFLGHRDDVPASRSRSLIHFFEALNAVGLAFSRPRLTEAAAARVMGNNAGYVRRLQRLFPGLDMPGADADAGDGDGRDWGSDEIGSVLDAVDPSLVEALTDLMPGYNRALRKGLDARASGALYRLDPEGSRAAAPFRAYLEREGCLKAAQALTAI
jgi:hypothetical protein